LVKATSRRSKRCKVPVEGAKRANLSCQPTLPTPFGFNSRDFLPYLPVFQPPFVITGQGVAKITQLFANWINQEKGLVETRDSEELYSSFNDLPYQSDYFSLNILDYVPNVTQATLNHLFNFPLIPNLPFPSLCR